MKKSVLLALTALVFAVSIPTAVYGQTDGRRFETVLYGASY